MRSPSKSALRQTSMAKAASCKAPALIRRTTEDRRKLARPMLNANETEGVELVLLSGVNTAWSIASPTRRRS